VKHGVIALCVGVLGCNEVLGLGGDFTVTESTTGGQTSGAAQAQASGAASTTGTGFDPQGATTGAGNGGDGAGGGSGSVGGGSVGTGGDGAGGGGGSEPATCEAYCDIINANCTNANAEYGPNVCPVMCANMTKGNVGDTTGDTVGCRLTKAGLAEDDPVTYCQQAGPLGVDGCAEPCEAFCSQLFATCLTDEVVPFTSFPECVQACEAVEYLRLEDGGSDLTTLTGENLNCWLYHLQVANSTGAVAHCIHIGYGPSSQCL